MKTEMVSYCFNYVCENLWWIYILQRGGDKMNELYHHGVKGMKWGVRRFQNKDGTLTNLGKSRKNMDAVNDIASTMSKRDKKLLNLSGDVYQRSIDDGANVVKRIVKKVGDTPVSFLDITGDHSGVSISIGTRGGDEYRNKGYASAVAKQGKKWLDEHADEFDQVVWWVRKDNPGSIKIAQKIGLELDESSVLPDDPWIKYELKKNNTQKQ